jgi:UDP-GlcNAc:undecaprenyl-phosphate/decaprenyl-phosphate GlcNAc-1-phosphate transferase
MNLKMNPKWMAVLGIVLITSLVRAEEPTVLKTSRDKVSYGVGVEMARNFKDLVTELDVDLVIKGFQDELSGKKLLIPDRELRRMMTMFHAELKREQGPARIFAAEEYRKGEAFLAENRKKEGVVTLPSGLQYKILKAGDGKKPADADTVECHYRGTLINGSVFDSSDLGGRPSTLEVKGLIPGWREGLKLMPVGSKWQIFIPPQLAYGERGNGRDIGPNQTLIVELELLTIK